MLMQDVCGKAVRALPIPSGNLVRRAETRAVIRADGLAEKNGTDADTNAETVQNFVQKTR